MKEITKRLFDLQDITYRQFHAKLIPTIDYDKIIGIRTPDIRKYAKELAGNPMAKDFLNELPHTYYEENNLHSALLSLIYKDIEEFIEKLEDFLPYVDNWATCDMIAPKIFKKNPGLVYEYVKKWIHSDNTYTVRFAIVTLLGYFLDETFNPEMLDLVASVKSDEYYINMAIAWYFSIALVKQYDIAIAYFTTPHLDIWIHNKSLQKAMESRRIDTETKLFLKKLKIKK